MNIGSITPIDTNAAMKLKIAKKIIINPATLKNNSDCSPFESLVDAKLIKASIGNVPKANTSIVIAPIKKLPVVKE